MGSAYYTLRNASTQNRIRGDFNTPHDRLLVLQKLSRDGRGLPSGYVSKLEARLAETEAALCHVLDLGHGRRTQRQAGGVISGPDSPDNGGFSKGDRVKEWDRWPLQSTRDIQEWYRERIHGVARATSPTSTAYTSASRDTNHYSFARSAARTTSTEVVRETPLERGFNTGHLARELQEGVATLTPAPDASHGVSDGQQASRAAELSESQRNIYF